MNPKMKTKISSGEILTLEDSEGFHSSLGVIKTSNDSKKETIKQIRSDLEMWLSNKNFDTLRNEIVDLAIVLYVSTNRMERQDVDNIAKIILDAICKNKDHDGSYLLNNDNQIIRLLVYKLQKDIRDDAETDQFIISFRKHNPSKEMTMSKKRKSYV